ncbi:MAG: hypothetical protein ABIQ73_17945 [Acidimicrobiales bacterium]
MKKIIVAAVAAASLTSGALAVAALAPIGIAAAQDSGQQQTAPDSTTNRAAKTKPERRAAVGARIKQRVSTRRGEVAEYLGLTPDALKQELQSGKSLAEIAGPKTQGLVEMLTAKANARIDAALAAGKIDESRAATLHAKVGPAIERLVNAKRPG